MIPKGKSGNPVEVDEDGRISGNSIGDFRLASNKGDAYSWTVETKDTAAADTMILVRNDHPSLNLHIEKFKLHGDTNGEIEVHCPTATFTAAGTAVVGESFNRNTQKTAKVTAISDETGNTQGDVIERFYLKTDTDYEIDWGGALILGNDQAVGADTTASQGEVYASIWGYFQ